MSYSSRRLRNLDRRATSWVLIALQVGALAACDGEMHPPASSTDAGLPDAEIQQVVDGSMAAANGLSISLESSTLSVCPGECATLTARTAGARGTPQLTWNEGLSADAVQNVCPARTTTYRVDANVFSEAVVELSMASQSASTEQTIVVRGDCENGHPPALGPGKTCSYRVPVAGPPISLGSLFATAELDAAGNMYLGGYFDEPIRLGDVVVEGDDWTATMVMKLSPACELLWFRVFHSQALEDFAVDGQGNIALYTTFMHPGAFWQGPRYQQRLTKLNTQGELVWEKREAETETSGSYAHSDLMSFAPDGTLIAPLGSVCEPDPRGLGRGCLVALDGAGSLRWSLHTSGNGGMGVAHDAQGNLIVSGLAYSDDVSLGDEVLSDGQHTTVAYTGKVTPAGAVEWLRIVPKGSDGAYTDQHNARRVTSGNVLGTWLHPNTVDGQSIGLWKLDSNGVTLSSLTRPLPLPIVFDPDVEVLPTGELVAITGLLNPMFPGSWTSGPLALFRLSDELAIESQQAIPTPGFATGGGLHVARDGTVTFTVSEKDQDNAYTVATVFHRMPMSALQ